MCQSYSSVDMTQIFNCWIDKEKNQVIPSLVTVNSLGASVAEQIVKARNDMPFTSIEDFKIRAHVGDKLVALLRSLNAFGDLPEDDQLTLF